MRLEADNDFIENGTAILNKIIQTKDYEKDRY